MKYKELDAVFDQMNQVFKEVDKTFKTMEQVMDQAFVARKQEVGPWKPWFAWRPVKVKDKQVWMKKIYRRKLNTYVDHDNWARYEYGTIFDVIKDAN